MKAPKTPAPQTVQQQAAQAHVRQTAGIAAAASPVLQGRFPSPRVLQGTFASPLVQRGNLPSPGARKAGLPAPVQGKMEAALGADFSGVQFKQDSAQATQMGALAYTQGEEVHFAPGQYDPHSQKGQKLIGHELTHVVQQRAGRVQATTQMKGVGVNTDQGLEREADLAGEKAAQGVEAGHINPSAPDSIQMALPAFVAAIWAAITSTSAVSATTVIAATAGTAAIAGQVASAVQAGNTGVQNWTFDKWMTDRDKNRLAIIAQYRMINRYVQWLRDNNPEIFAAAKVKAKEKAVPNSEQIKDARQFVQESAMKILENSVSNEIIGDLLKPRTLTNSPEYLWGDSDSNYAETFGTTGSIKFFEVQATRYSEKVGLSSDSKQIALTSLPEEGQAMEIRQIMGGLMKAGPSFAIGTNDDLAINVAGGKPQIFEGMNAGHGLLSFVTDWTWDDNHTYLTVDVWVGGDGSTGFSEHKREGTPDD